MQHPNGPERELKLLRYFSHSRCCVYEEILPPNYGYVLIYKYPFINNIKKSWFGQSHRYSKYQIATQVLLHQKTLFRVCTSNCFLPSFLSFLFLLPFFWGRKKNQKSRSIYKHVYTWHSKETHYILLDGLWITFSLQTENFK
jgi:hypothetical protein